MRRREQAVTDPAGLEQILRQGRVCQLAIPDLPTPYSVPLSYGYRGGVLYFHSAPAGHKIELLRCHPQVGFSVVVELGIQTAERACDWGVGYLSVLGRGRVEFIEDLDSKRSALKLLMAQYGEGEFDFPAAELAKTAVFRLVIEEMTGKRSQG